MAQKKIICLCTVIVSCFCLAEAVQADEFSELKEQSKVIQKQMQEQARQMEVMQEKIKQLEAESQARIEMPKEMKERVIALEEKIAKKDSLNVSWKDGLSFTSDDEQFSIKVGGRLHMDAGWFRESSGLKDAVGNSKDDGEIRRARFYMKGTMYENFLYCLEYDWATSPASLKHAFIGLKNIPYLGTIRAGHHFEPFGLETMTSSNYLTFVEYGLSAAFWPSRNMGITASSNLFDERMTWATGVFRDADNQGNLTGNKYNWSSRLTFLPLYEENGRKLFHLGGTYSLRSPAETLRYRSRPEAHQAQYFVDTGSISAKRAHNLGIEAAFVNGPLSIQAEYVGSIVNQTSGPSNTYFQGGYIYGSYFLTGEHRSYSKSSGVFSRLRPLKNFSPKADGLGAWEVLLRYSYLDLTDDNISGGNMSDVTLGLNWYLNPNMKIMWNYIHSQNREGDADIFLTRVQVTF